MLVRLYASIESVSVPLGFPIKSSTARSKAFLKLQFASVLGFESLRFYSILKVL